MPNSGRPSRSPELLDADRSHLLVIDMQEKLLPVVHEHAAIQRAVELLLHGSELFHVPVTISEQYPKGLGATVASVTDRKGTDDCFEKLRFSAAGPMADRLFGNSAHDEMASLPQRDQLVIVGIETHICVLQTAIDLLYRGLSVYVVADAVGSRKPMDHHTALARLRDAGAVICSAESVVFEWCEEAGSDTFRQLSRIVQEFDAAR